MAEYNGWTNYETWCVHVWISNDQSSQAYSNELAVDAIVQEYRYGDEDLSGDKKRDRAVYALSQALQDWVEEGSPEVEGMYSDLLRSAIQSVNFYELAGSYVDVAWEEAMGVLGFNSVYGEE